MKTRYKILIGIGFVISILFLVFFFLGMNKSWVKNIDENSEIELTLTYAPIGVYENSPEVSLVWKEYNDSLKSQLIRQRLMN